MELYPRKKIVLNGIVSTEFPLSHNTTRESMPSQ